MADMDSWCPSCGYSVEPGTRFCNGCGHEFTDQPGAGVAQSPAVSMQASAGSYPGYGAPAGPPLPAPSASLPPAPPPPSGNPLPYPPPPVSGPPAPYPAPGQPGWPVPPGQQMALGQGPSPAVSDSVERMLRPQGLFHPLPPAPAEWQTPPAPAPGYRAGGQYPTPPGPYPPGAQPAQAGGFSPAGPPAWPGSPGLPSAPGGYPPGGYPAPNGNGQYPDPQYQSGGQYPGGAPVSGGPVNGAVAAGPYPGAPYAGEQYPGGQPGNGQYPNGQYPGGQYPGGQYPGGQYPNGQQTAQLTGGQYPGAYGQDATTAGQYSLGGQYGPDGLPAPADAGAAGGPLGRLGLKRPKRALIPIAVVAVVVIIVAVALTLSSGGNSPTSSTSASSSTGASTPGGSASGKALSQQQAASALSGLLSQSGTDHADVNAAVTSVEACKNLTGDAKTFNRAASNRRALLAKLARLPGRPALSPTMLADLTGAWQASATVDSHLAKWATDGVSGCKKNNLKDPSYTASVPFDSTATNDKTAFVKAWNSLARRYGYPSYTPSQL